MSDGDSALRRSFTFPADVGTAAAARRALDSVARLDPIRLTEAQLLVSELIANALQHGELDVSAEVLMTVETKPTGVTISIAHRSPGGADLSERGMGFTLVDHLARRWGVSTGDGDVFEVWFEVRAAGANVAILDLDDDEILERAREDEAYRDEAIRRYRSLATSLAGRFRGKGISDADIEQVALVGLLSAVSRYEPEKGPFKPYAIATIRGALKRQLRDRAWFVRVPRGLQERSLLVSRTAEALAQSLGRTVRPADIAAELGIEVGHVLEGMAAISAYQWESIDMPNESTGASLSDFLHDETWVHQLDEWRELAEGIQSLSPREQELLYLRFYGDLTQSEIADQLGISQVHVSRLLARAIERLRHLVD